MNKNVQKLMMIVVLLASTAITAQEAQQVQQATAQHDAVVAQIKEKAAEAKDKVQAWTTEADQSWQKAKQDLQDAQVQIKLLLTSAQQKLAEAQKWVQSRLNVATTPEAKIGAISEELRTRVQVIDTYIKSVEILSKPMKVLNPELYATTQQLIIALRSSNEFLTTLADRLNGIVTALQNKAGK